jgi:hypothetical protein
LDTGTAFAYVPPSEATNIEPLAQFANQMAQYASFFWELWVPIFPGNARTGRKDRHPMDSSGCGVLPFRLFYQGTSAKNLILVKFAKFSGKKAQKKDRPDFPERPVCLK